MRRLLGSACAVAVLVASPVLAASSGPTAVYRHIAGDYTMTGGATAGSGTAVLTGAPTVSDTARATEDRVTVAARDDAGSAVALSVQVTSTDGTSTQTVTCDDLTLPVSQGVTVQATPLTGTCPDGRTSIPRTGTIDLSFRHLVLPAKKGVASPANRWAVLIGIQKYANGTEPTVGGVGDVQAVRNALLGSGWSSSHILMVTDGAATASGIRSALSWLVAHSTPSTFSLLHYSGHICIASRGPCASGHTYLWSQDNRFLPENEIAGTMKQVQGHAWLDISGCEGGAFDVGFHSASRLFTSSSKASETSYEEPRWHESVWSGLAWDQGYNQGMADTYGRAHQATIGQVAAFGAQEAARYTGKQSAGAQHPVVAGGSGAWTLTEPPGSS